MTNDYEGLGLQSCAACDHARRVHFQGEGSCQPEKPGACDCAEFE